MTSSLFSEYSARLRTKLNQFVRFCENENILKDDKLVDAEFIMSLGYNETNKRESSDKKLRDILLMSDRYMYDGQECNGMRLYNRFVIYVGEPPIMSSDIILRCGLSDINWSTTVTDSAWGLPSGVSDDVVKRINKSIDMYGSVCVWFMTTKKSDSGKIVAYSIITQHITRVTSNGISDSDMGWVNKGSNKINISQEYKWRMVLDESINKLKLPIMLADINTVNGASISQQTVHILRKRTALFLSGYRKCLVDGNSIVE